MHFQGAYGQFMSADPFDSDHEELENSEIRVRCDLRLKEKYEGLAKAQSLARQLRDASGQVSVNRLAISVLERHLAAFEHKHGVPVPKSKTDSTAIEKAAIAINEIRERELSKKKSK